jgi:hypothetical protein
MAIVTRSWSAGETARKKPARDAPMAGVSLAVRVLATRGLRRRKGRALSVSSDSRSRVKKRCRRRWKRRMRAREEESLKLSDFQSAVLIFGLVGSQHQSIQTKAVLDSLRSTAGEKSSFDHVPDLQSRICCRKYSNRSSYRRGIIVVLGLEARSVFWRRNCSLPYRWRARQQVLVKQPVLALAQCVSQRIANDGIDGFARIGARGGRAYRGHCSAVKYCGSIRLSVI